LEEIGEDHGGQEKEVGFPEGMWGGGGLHGIEIPFQVRLETGFYVMGSKVRKFELGIFRSLSIAKLDPF
jgi:hypothetical protein